MEETIVQNGEVEVTSEEEGFNGAWYRAILEENPTESGRKNLRVRYLTLLNDDGSAPLTAMVDRRFIRPVPPENLYDGVFLKEGSVVDADLKGGWWVGLVIEKIEYDQKYLVYFDSLPDIIQFERRQLKPHLDWTDSKWVRPEHKQLVRSGFSFGEMVELREDFAWREVMIVKELENEKRFIVKKCNNSFSCSVESENETVDSLRVRPMQPHFSVREYELLDRVEAFSGFVWRQGMVRTILCDGYIISFRETKEEQRFNRSDLRPLMEWKDKVWHKRVKRESEEETTSDGKRNKSMASETINEMADDNDIITTPVKQEKAHGKTLKTMKTHNGLGNESTREKMCEEHNSRKRKTKSVVLPFTKKSSVWKIYESMEVFKRVPQTPHFSSLTETKEDFREGFALGMMATFTWLLEKLKDLDTDVPTSELDSLKDSFFEVEKHGFNIRGPLSRIDKLLAIKGRELNMLEELKGFDKETMDESSKMRKAEEEFDEMERKILELQRQQVVRKEHKETAYGKICEIESRARDVRVKLKDLESEFETIVSAPW